MQDFDKILALASDEKVELSKGFKDLLHKELALGMTAYVCKNGSLGDGHEHITPAQRYYQAVKEMYGLGNNMALMKAQAMEAQAEMLDATEALESATKQSDKLRAEARLMRAKQSLTNALVTTEDQMRQLNAFNEVRLELQDQVRAQYPGGIEQAEPDHWLAVAEYRAKKRANGYPEQMTHVPLDPVTKAKVGLALNAPEMCAWLEVSENKALKHLAGGDTRQLINLIEGQLQLIQQKEGA